MMPSTPRTTAFTLALLAFCLQQVSAATIAYCSSQNTGSDNDDHVWTWQSNGYCGDQCRSDYAFAIVQGNDCWCSNYIPAQQQDTGGCNVDCPGFPSEKCGNKDEGLFGYIALVNKPSGTQGGSQPTSSSDPTSAAPTTFKTSASSSNTNPPATTPISSVEVVTLSVASGVIVSTRTIVITPTAGAPAQIEKKKSTNTGAIVGGVLGGLAFLAAVAGLVVFLLWKRRRPEEPVEEQSGVQRNVSTMSKAGLLRGEKQPPQITTTFAKRNSRILDNDSISPISGSDRRNSRPYLFDQRLNPSAIMALDNTSRGSFGSLDDSRDYGRELNVRNPDPEPHE